MSKRKENGNVDHPPPDSTTKERTTFSIGDEVLMQRKDGNFYLGTVVKIDLSRDQCQVKFGDNTETWSSFARLTKLSTGLRIMCVKCKISHTENDNDIVICDKCSRGYHQKCHYPVIGDEYLKDDAIWECMRCTGPERRSLPQRKSSAPPPPPLPPQPPPALKPSPKPPAPTAKSSSLLNNQSKSTSSPKSGALAQSKVSASPQTKPVPSPQTKPTPPPQTKPAPSPQTKPVPSPQTKPVPSPQTKPVPSPQTKPVPSPQTKPALPSQTKPAQSPQAKVIPTSPQTKPASSPQTKSAPSPQTKSAPSPQTKSVLSPQTPIPVQSPQTPKPVQSPQTLKPVQSPQTSKPVQSPQTPKPAPSPHTKPDPTPQTKPSPSPQINPPPSPESQFTPSTQPKPGTCLQSKSTPTPLAKPTTSNPTKPVASSPTKPAQSPQTKPVLSPQLKSTPPQTTPASSSQLKPPQTSHLKPSLSPQTTSLPPTKALPSLQDKAPSLPQHSEVRPSSPSAKSTPIPQITSALPLQVNPVAAVEAIASPVSSKIPNPSQPDQTKSESAQKESLPQKSSSSSSLPTPPVTSALGLQHSLLRKLPFPASELSWDLQHRVNNKNKYCYCGGPGKWFLKMLQCGRCRQWFHGRCLSTLRYPLFYGDRFYVCICHVCNSGKELVRRLEIKWIDLIHIAIFNLTLKTAKKYHDVDDDILKFINTHWNELQLPPKIHETSGDKRRENVISVLTGNRNRFKGTREVKSRKTKWGLRVRVPPPMPVFCLPRNNPLSEQVLADAWKNSARLKFLSPPPRNAIIPKPEDDFDLSKLKEQLPGVDILQIDTRLLVLPKGCPRDGSNICIKSSTPMLPEPRALKRRLKEQGMESRKPRKFRRLLRSSTREDEKEGQELPPTPPSSESNPEAAPAQHDSSGDETSSRGTLDSIIPPPADFEGRNNPFLPMVPVLRTVKRRLSEKDIVVTSTGEVKRKKVRRSKLARAGEANTRGKLKRLKSSPTPTTSPVKNQPSISLEELKSSVNQYFGAVNRIASGEQFSVRAKRITLDGRTQYLINWGSPS